MAIREDILHTLKEQYRVNKKVKKAERKHCMFRLYWGRYSIFTCNNIRICWKYALPK